MQPAAVGVRVLERRNAARLVVVVVAVVAMVVVVVVMVVVVVVMVVVVVVMVVNGVTAAGESTDRGRLAIDVGDEHG